MLRPCLFLATSLLAVQVVLAEEATPSPATAVAPPAVQETESQQRARSVLMEMAKFLADTETFGVKLRVGYDVVQGSGQKIEFGEIRDIAVQRPNRVRVEEAASDGRRRDLILFDGKNVTTLHGDTGVYAQTPQPGDIDATVVHFVRDLKMRLPLAPLFMSHFGEELSRRVQTVDYVESTDILGQAAHHIAGRTPNVDFQVWVAEGKRPLPLRIVLTYTKLEGQPQFWAQFSQWNLAPKFGKATFEFKPPAGAKQIAFAAQLLPQAGEAQTQKEGGQQ